MIYYNIGVLNGIFGNQDMVTTRIKNYDNFLKSFNMYKKIIGMNESFLIKTMQCDVNYDYSSFYEIKER